MYDEDGADQSIGDGVEQFQRAALDAVRATRAMLDAVETVIQDPRALDSVVRTMTSFVRAAGETVVGFASGSNHAPGAAWESGGAPEPRTDDGHHHGFERIQVD